MHLPTPAPSTSASSPSLPTKTNRPSARLPSHTVRGWRPFRISVAGN
jgi:hypothetical protein